MRLILVRHGETVENSSRVVQGQLPGVLSDRGKRQAGAAGNLLKEYHIDAAYSSDLSRAWETASIITAFHPGITVIAEPRLREQHLGRLQGGPVVALMRQLKEKGADITSFDPDDGEPSAKFRERVAGAIGYISERHPEETVLAVTHHGVIRVFLDIFASGVTPEQVKHMSGNGAMTFATIDGPVLQDIHSLDYSCGR